MFRSTLEIHKQRVKFHFFFLRANDKKERVRGKTKNMMRHLNSQCFFLDYCLFGEKDKTNENIINKIYEGNFENICRETNVTRTCRLK